MPLRGGYLKQLAWDGGKSRISRAARPYCVIPFCYRRRKTLVPQGPRKLPKLDLAGSTPVARSSSGPSLIGAPSRIEGRSLTRIAVLASRRLGRSLVPLVHPAPTESPDGQALGLENNRFFAAGVRVVTKRQRVWCQLGLGMLSPAIPLLWSDQGTMDPQCDALVGWRPNANG